MADEPAGLVKMQAYGIYNPILEIDLASEPRRPLKLILQRIDYLLKWIGDHLIPPEGHSNTVFINLRGFLVSATRPRQIRNLLGSSQPKEEATTSWFTVRRPIWGVFGKRNGSLDEAHPNRYGQEWLEEQVPAGWPDAGWVVLGARSQGLWSC